MSDDLKFVVETEAAIATWREARDEIAQRKRIDERIAADKAAYEQRTRYRMPAPMEQENRKDLEAQEAARTADAQAKAVQAYDAARKTIGTVRTAAERLRPKWQEMEAGSVADNYVMPVRTLETTEEGIAQSWIQHGALGPIVDQYLKSSDEADRTFVRAVETAVELGLEKFRDGEQHTRADAEVLLKLRQAITARQRARWPAWTHDADARLSKVMNVNDSAFLELQKMGRIA